VGFRLEDHPIDAGVPLGVPGFREDHWGQFRTLLVAHLIKIWHAVSKFPELVDNYLFAEHDLELSIFPHGKSSQIPLMQDDFLFNEDFGDF
jgi:hypothetical protein